MGVGDRLLLMSKRKHRLVWDYYGDRKRITCISCQSLNDTESTLIWWPAYSSEHWQTHLDKFYENHSNGTELVVDGTWKKDQY